MNDWKMDWISMISERMPSCLARVSASPVSSLGVKSVGIKTPKTLLEPRASTRSLATKLLSTPPLSPTTAPLTPASFVTFRMKATISLATESHSISKVDIIRRLTSRFHKCKIRFGYHSSKSPFVASNLNLLLQIRSPMFAYICAQDSVLFTSMPRRARQSIWGDDQFQRPLS